jgi:glycosyltransferase involved in cell wall biosynthesis
MAATQEPLVSVAIPAYNAAAFIERTLESVRRQTYRNLEVVVVDDGSDDGTAEIIARSFPEAKVIREKQQGKPRAVARGVAETTGEYLALLDHDDEWLPEKIERQMQVMAEHPGVALLLSQPFLVPPGQEPTLGIARFRLRADGVLKAVSFKHFFFATRHSWMSNTTSSWLIRKKVFEDLGGFADWFPVDDWEFLLRATGRGYSVAVLCEPLFYYHLTPDSSGRPLDKGDYPVWLLPEIKASYDPRGQGWKARLLDEREYSREMESNWLRCARQCWRRGHRDKVPEMYRRAEEVARRLGRWHYLLFRARLVGQYAYSFVRSALFRSK